MSKEIIVPDFGKPAVNSNMQDIQDKLIYDFH